MLTQQQIHAIALRLVEIIEDADDELIWDSATETRIISYSTIKTELAINVKFAHKVITAALEGDTHDAQQLCIDEMRRVGVDQIAEAISDYETLPYGFKWEDYL